MNRNHIITTADLEQIRKALKYAADEIHSPGAANAGDYDIFDMIDHACHKIRNALNHIDMRD